MLKRMRICEKFLKRKLEGKVVAQLVAGKILRSAEIRFEVLEKQSKLIAETQYYVCREKYSNLFQLTILI